MERKLKSRFEGFEAPPSDSLWNRIEQQVPEGSFESQLRHKLDQVTLEPSDANWYRIEAELPGSQSASGRSGSIIWRWATFTSLVLVSGLAYFLISREMLERVPVQQAPITQNTIPAPETPQQRPTSEPVATPSIPTNETSSALAASQTPVSINAGNTEPRIKPDAPVVQQKPTPIVKESQQVIALTQPAVPTAIPEVKSAATVGIADVPPPSTAETAKADMPSQNKSELVAVTAEQPSNPESQSVTTPDTSTQPMQPVTVSSAPESGIPALPAVVKSADSTTQNVTASASKLIGSEELTRVSISVVAGLNWGFMDLYEPEGVSPYPLHENRLLRESVEKPAIDWSVAFHLNYHLNTHWMLTSGFGQLALSQEFFYNTTNPVLPPNPEKGIFINSSDSIVTGSGYKSTIRYTWTEIPLLLTYTFSPAKKWHISLQGGFSYAKLSQVDAAMINYDNVGVLIVNEQTAFPGFKDQFFVQFNPAINFRINPQTEVAFQPGFRYGINSMIERENWLQQRPLLGGASVLLRRRF